MKHKLCIKIRPSFWNNLLIILYFLIACQDENPPISPPPPTTPSPTSSTTIIGPAGGTAYSADGILALEILPNTLSNPVPITIKRISVVTPDFRNGKNIGTAYELEPSGTKFSNPINININYKGYSNEISNPENLAVLHIGTKDDKFIELISAQNNLNDKILSFSIDHFSGLKIIEFENKWAVFDYYWTIPVIKWYLEVPTEKSYLNETNIQFALNLWAKETSSFSFERTFDESQANIIFKEVYFYEGFEVFKNAMHIYEGAVGMASLDFWSYVFEGTLESNDRVRIILASNEFTFDNENINLFLAREAITHEIGHALGIAHTVGVDLPYPVMYSTLSSIELWNEKLHEWDVNALHVHYKKAEDNRQLVLEHSWLLYDTYTNPSRYEKLSYDGSALWASELRTKDLVSINIDDNLSVQARIPDPTANLSEYGYQPQFGLTWDGNNLWSCDAAGGGPFVDTVYANPGRYTTPYLYINTGKIYKHANDQSLSVLSQFPAPGPFPFALAWDGTNLWCYDNYQNIIYKLNSDGTIINSYPVSGFIEFPGPWFNSGGEIYDLAWDGSSLWAITWFSGRIYKCGIVNGVFMPVKTYKTFLTEPRIGIEWAENYLYVVSYRRTIAEGIGIDKFALK